MHKYNLPLFGIYSSQHYTHNNLLCVSHSSSPSLSSQTSPFLPATLFLTVTLSLEGLLEVEREEEEGGMEREEEGAEEREVECATSDVLVDLG